MSEASVVQKLVDQCRSNDVDVKVDALTKLQVEFEHGVQIPDVDDMIEVVKSCLRSSNLHLTSATVSALPPLLPLLVSTPLQNGTQPLSSSSSTSSTAQATLLDLATLRHLMSALLPQGGVFERLGDRERAQVKARETLVVLGGLAFRAPGSSGRTGNKAETPLAMFERFLRDSGLASKVWKVREQSILVLVHIRRKHHMFPLRPYLPLLVSSLEDTDAHVRETAKSSVVELFSGPGVLDSARADLKKELTKKGVRKTIVDTVLSKILGGGRAPSTPLSEGSDTGDPPPAQPYLPPSMALAGRRPTAAGTPLPRTVSLTIRSMPTPVAVPTPSPITPSESMSGGTSEVQPVYIASARDMETEFADMQKPFEGKETEHNWAAREQAVLRVRGMLKGDAHVRYEDTFLAALKDGFIQWSLKTLASLRTTVCVNTCALYIELAAALGTAFDPFSETVLSNLLGMANFTKKIASQQSQLAFAAVMTHTSAQPRVILPLLYNSLQEKSTQARTYAIAHIKDYLISHGQQHKVAIESSGSVDILERAIKKSLSDANPAVKEGSRATFWAFEAVWQDRGQAIFASLDPLAGRQLEKACPSLEASTRLQVSTPATTTKKSSVAAAIAASRAKARAIANAPPTLRHQATSASHAVRATSPPLRRTVSPVSPPRKSGVSPTNSTINSTTRPSSPLRSAGSPPATSSRIRNGTSNGIIRSVSAGNLLNSNTTTTSRTTTTAPRRSASPTIPSATSTIKRRTSSPLAPSVSRLSITQIAANTALPNSPPTSSVILTAPSPPRRPPVRLTSIVPDPRNSMAFPDFDADDDLMRASGIPIPHDSDSDEDSNPLSFSAAFERERHTPHRPPPSKSNSQVRSSPKSQDINLNKHEAATSNALSTASQSGMEMSTSTLGQPVVEDALRARAEQAESAAERLLELVEPDEEGESSIPSSLLVGNSALTPKPKGRPAPNISGPMTPMNKNTAILKQVATFKNSPAQNGGSLRALIQDQRHETGWWLKRVALLGQEASPQNEESCDHATELKDLIDSVESGHIDTTVLKKLALLSSEVTTNDTQTLDDTFDTHSPFIDTTISPSQSDIWNQDKNFSRLFEALKDFCSRSKEEEELEYALILLWELLENQAPYIEGREADVFELLLEVRNCNHINVLEATNTIRDALTAKVDPVYGLTTMHATLRAFSAQPNTDPVLADIRSSTCAFALIALGKFILRLPAEILEEELPRMRTTMISSLNDQSSLVVRESAAAALISAQVVLRDEASLFSLLEGLADEKKNLLTYLFDKHSVRGVALKGKTGMEKLERELKRLDTKTSTPPRSSLKK